MLSATEGKRLWWWIFPINNDIEVSNENPLDKSWRGSETDIINQTKLIPSLKMSQERTSLKTFRIIVRNSAKAREIWSWQYCLQKCEFKSHIKGLLRIHKLEDHQRKETFETIVDGFRKAWKDLNQPMVNLDPSMGVNLCCSFTFLTFNG